MPYRKEILLFKTRVIILFVVIEQVFMVKADKINITETLDNARKQLETDKQISPALRAMFEMLLMIITLLTGKLGLNSQNSSKPPSTDPNRKKKQRGKGNNKPGGQPGRLEQRMT